MAKKIEGLRANPNKTELKVLNLDRLFREKNGKMGNIVPIPFAKMGEVSSRKNVSKILKKKDPIHDVIEEYNKLLRITRLKKTKPKIGVRGHNFTKSPTLEELVGIKPQIDNSKKYLNEE